MIGEYTSTKQFPIRIIDGLYIGDFKTANVPILLSLLKPRMNC